MKGKRVFELLDRVDQTIAQLERRNSSADRAAAWTKTALCVVVGIVLLLFSAVDPADAVKTPLYPRFPT